MTRQERMLAAERGEEGPEGWVYCVSFWTRTHGEMFAIVTRKGWAFGTNSRSDDPIASGDCSSMLEGMEATDVALAEWLASSSSPHGR